jgi:hypothetical protein
MPPTSSQVVNAIKNLQDYQLLLATKELEKDSTAFQSYSQGQRDALLTEINDTKKGVFDKVYSDSTTAANSVMNTYYYYRSNKELLDTNSKLASKTAEEGTNLKYNHDLAKRQFELNEWAVQNKRDTLFVYQFGFIAVCAVTILTLLKKNSILPGGLYYYLLFTVIAIFIMIVLYKAIYGERVRDKFYWNKRKFGKYATTPASGSECPTLTDMAFNSVQSATDNVQSTLDWAINWE